MSFTSQVANSGGGFIINITLPELTERRALFSLDKKLTKQTNTEGEDLAAAVLRVKAALTAKGFTPAL
ncbi:MAG: hypothetical protein EOP84_18215 [Verrucomicrobiaceae bacterium]|nr:MAG: hypothetical protein EOP84_18215 [Verrucomicrobiaceae bacterium]